MASKPPAYPFEPKSNAYLRPGQFWGFELSDGRHACGRVIAVADPKARYGARTLFVAGLMNWIGDQPPTSDALSGAGLVDHGWAHVQTIREHGGSILGCRELRLDGLESYESAAADPWLVTWGLDVIEVLAEAHLVAGRRPGT